ncbi:MAG: GNAT family N-acetyltransferase, partial [Actinobacteria bacterium]|nr:GNAT family N-acetyltransferase [Actinomycetota bacterium]
MSDQADSTKLRFRVATPADADAVAALVQSAYRGESSRTGWTTEADLLTGSRIDRDGVLEKIDTPHSFILLAVTAATPQRIDACCEIAFRGDGLAYFGLFAVDPGRQAGGIGRRVLAQAEHEARTRWAATVMEMTVIGHRAELIEWYGRRGYELTAQTRPFPY